MKIVAAILLMGILLFNWFGYRVLSDILQDRANRTLESELDSRSYAESSLISIKLPATHLSYYNNSATFERLNGEVEINGVIYHFVKRRIFNDSIELRCIRNSSVQNLRLSRDNYFKLTNDIQRPQQGRQGTAKSFAVDPYTFAGWFQLSEPGFITVDFHLFIHTGLPSIPGTVAERPPACRVYVA